ncbi:DUF3466 family protein [Meiothermus granaticius]|uniref:Putative extracellular repeat, HAF family n=1 Tax=Meiothermus granaticius NBRC 107808 TaxID=1227551 RepID=A0A399F600_9DEIN|nr:DUF3466 family protein [Meiothermus granaticius]RIH91056.1 putative extracellular repeat, HAF family [Meiothermus granaticius NBRC 107808]GEM86512.1 hypothetical protein MGR01S_11370 [Meiothermus granaticius NBRC 107808]
MKTYIQTLFIRSCRYWLALALPILLLSCGQPSPPPPQAVRVEVTPGGLLLTRAGESQTLRARAYDAQGREIKAAFTYSSSNPAIASVTPEGRITAQADLGSARVVVQAGQTRAEVGVMVAQPVVGATLVSDSQVVLIEGTDPNAPFEVGYRYIVTLEGVSPPAVGSVLMSQGSLPVAGRVLEVRQNGNQTLVTLELVSIDQLLSRYRLQETFDLRGVSPHIPQDVEENFEITPEGGGRYSLSLKPDKSLSTTALGPGAVRPMVDFNLGPLKCSTDAGSALNVSVNKVDVKIDLSSLGFELLWTDQTKRLLLVGKPKVQFTFEPRLSAAIAGKVSCKMQFFEIPLPVPGVLFAVAKLYNPVGAGFELEGQIPVANASFKASTELLLSLRTGLECNPDCSVPHEITQEQVKPDLKWTLPEVPSGVKLEARAGGFAYLSLNTGLRAWMTKAIQVVGIRVSDYEFFIAKAGVNLEGQLASEETQVKDANFAARYGLKAELSIGTGKDLQKALEALKLPITAVSFKFPFELASSPRAISLIADRNSFRAGDTVRFRVNLGDTQFPVLGYQVEAVRVYHNTGTPENPVLVLANQATASPGQTEFELPWVATVDGQVVEGSGNSTRRPFVAFVKTRLLDTRLELGNVGVGCAGSANVQYCITDLGTLGGSYSIAWEINENGQVVGESRNTGGQVRAFLWQDNQMTDLGTLGGSSSEAYGINENGQIVGSSSTDSGQDHAFLWQNGQMTNLGTLGGSFSLARKINNNGQITGWAANVSGQARAFRWQNGQMTNLGTLGGSLSAGYAINQSGQVAGESHTPGGEFRGFLWQNEQSGMINLGTLGGNRSEAYALNNLGQVVGISILANGQTHAFLWQNGQMTDLGTLGGRTSTAWGINDQGVVVGSSENASNTNRAFIWRNGQMSDLNSLIDSTQGWVLTEASDINNQGQIVGYGRFNGQTRAFLLTPIR